MVRGVEQNSGNFGSPTYNATFNILPVLMLNSPQKDFTVALLFIFFSRHAHGILSTKSATEWDQTSSHRVIPGTQCVFNSRLHILTISMAPGQQWHKLVDKLMVSATKRNITRQLAQPVVLFFIQFLLEMSCDLVFQKGRPSQSQPLEQWGRQWRVDANCEHGHAAYMEENLRACSLIFCVVADIELQVHNDCQNKPNCST
mmetsp:Transcript_126359/g.252511  ORF Transcript_126359/g.252511 Transcript_126359/m.252511 type:complete len:201 (+) Transcript_126359:661-1263(+)